MNIAVVGTGYVGLVTGTCFSETGNNVICVDIDQEKVHKLRSGIVPIYEPHLDVIFERNIKQGRLKFTTHLHEAVEKAQVIFLALPTPPDEDGSADLTYVLGAAKDIGDIINDYKVIVNKSTVPVGTAEKVQKIIAGRANVDFDVISNPEFLREGFAVDDFLKPDRVIVGANSERARKVMSLLYAPYVRQGNPVIFMDTRSAELTKYAANAFLATKISFMNEIANMCEILGANVDNVRIGIGSDNRIGKRFLFPGIGYGGSCFPKDVMALVKMADNEKYDFKILKAVTKVNKYQRKTIVTKIRTYFGESLSKRKIAIWGLSFKPDTDDVREAPAFYIIDELIKDGASIAVYDPEAMNNARKKFRDKVLYSFDPYEALRDADALLIATEWSVFRAPDFERMKKNLKTHLIFDGRNLYNTEQMRELGFEYYSVGRETVNFAGNQ